MFGFHEKEEDKKKETLRGNEVSFLNHVKILIHKYCIIQISFQVLRTLLIQ